MCNLPCAIMILVCCRSAVFILFIWSVDLDGAEFSFVYSYVCALDLLRLRMRVMEGVVAGLKGADRFFKERCAAV